MAQQHSSTGSAPTGVLTAEQGEILVRRGVAHWDDLRAMARGESVPADAVVLAHAYKAEVAPHHDAAALALVSHTWGLAQILGCEPGENARGRGELLAAASRALARDEAGVLRSFIENGAQSVVLVDKAADPVRDVSTVVLQSCEILAENSTHRLVVLAEPVALRLREHRFGIVDGLWTSTELSSWTPVLSAVTLDLASAHMRERYAGGYEGERFELEYFHALATASLTEV